MDKLFEEWKCRDIHTNHLFITDGVIEQGKWDDSELKVLFLLKEAYDSKPEGKSGWDLPKLIREKWKGPKGKMWWSLAQWAYGLRELHKNGEVGKFEKNNNAVVSSLLSSAVVNIKKSNGKSRSNNDDLKMYVDSDWDLIERQIEEINPDVVVCGKTWSLIKGMLPHTKKVIGSDFVYESNGRYYVDFYHPANQYPNKMNYYALCAAVKLSGVV